MIDSLGLIPQGSSEYNLFQSLCQLKIKELAFYTSSPIHLAEDHSGSEKLDIDSQTLQAQHVHEQRQNTPTTQGGLRREGQGQGTKCKCLQSQGMGPKGQLKDPSDLAEVPKVSTTTSIHLKAFPKLEVSVRKGDRVTQKESCIC